MAFQEKALSLGTVETLLFECPVTLTGSAHGIVFSNITGASKTIAIKLYNKASGITTTIAQDRVVAANGEFSWPKPINLASGDQIIALASALNAVTAVVSIYLASSQPLATGFTLRGEHSAIATYLPNDVVSLNGSSYAAITQNVNSAPPSASWMVAAQKGDTGPSVAVADEGTQLTAAATAFNFTGGGVTATASGGSVTVNVPAPTATSVGLGGVDNTADSAKPVSTAQAAADAAVLASANAHSDALVVGLWDDRGSFNASVNTYPTTGGSGTAGAILKGDIWTISVIATSGVLLGYAVGTNVRAVVDTPGQTGTNWAVTEVGLGYVPENAANKRTSFQATPDDSHYASEKLVKDSLDGKQVTLVSGTNLKTVGGASLLGSGDITVGGSISVSGSASTYVTLASTFTILAPDSFTTYTVSATSGTASLSGATITYTAPSSACTDTLVVSGGGATKNISITVAAAGVNTPTNSAPSNAATGQAASVALSASAFSWFGISTTHLNSDWQVATDSGFSTVVASSMADSTNKTSWTVTGLSVNTTYYWRVRYRGANSSVSSYSSAFSFQTATSFNSYIATPTETPSFGASFEGGSYAGLIWNELVESSTSLAIATGSKAFAVADMTSAPIVYSGQALEVRSRANPANKFIGTVTGASGTTLTINVTSVGGSGTFADWSVMAKYRVIVAPKASGENSSIAFKNANTAAPAACGTLTEGKKATDAMVAADTSTVYPAAWWCHNLSIGGKSDWYLPARDELELAWRNLKPTTDANYTGADRSTGATPNYMNLGSYGDTANTHGLNNNSSPTGAAYTSGSPAQTSVSAFQTGNAEAFAYGSYYYWSASEYSTTLAWLQFWTSGAPGYQNLDNKANAYYVRAVRRSII